MRHCSGLIFGLQMKNVRPWRSAEIQARRAKGRGTPLHRGLARSCPEMFCHYGTTLGICSGKAQTFRRRSSIRENHAGIARAKTKSPKVADVLGKEYDASFFAGRAAERFSKACCGKGVELAAGRFDDVLPDRAACHEDARSRSNHCPAVSIPRLKSSRRRCSATARHQLANDPRRDRLTPRGLGEIALKVRDEGLGAGECCRQRGPLTGLLAPPVPS
jgi:hypothetical protein